MNAEDLRLLLRKVEELKALLVFTERTIPFLEDVIAFVQEIVPMVEDLKSSVESSTDKLPKASSQLAKVSTATEMATTEILNIVERMYGKVEQIGKDLEIDRQRLESLRGTAHTMEELLRSRNGAASMAEWVSGLSQTWATHMQSLAVAPAGANATAHLASIQEDCTNIMIALQVQDITAQQIAAVNKLMQSVDGGLSRLLRHFTRVATEQDDSKFRHRRLDIVFDTSAEYTSSDERQRVADAVVESSRRSGQSGKAGRARKKSSSRK